MVPRRSFDGACAARLTDVWQVMMKQFLHHGLGVCQVRLTAAPDWN
jgi:hypothetical protein